MARKAFPYTTFLAADGLPLSGGSVLISLDSDATYQGALICSAPIKFDLDDNGSIPAGLTFPVNADMQPSTTSYIVRSFTSVGQDVSSLSVKVA